MGYDFEAIADDGSTIATFLTNIDNTPAHALLGALGLDCDTDDTEGDGDTFFFTRGEISAAQAALVGAINPPPRFTEGLGFLAAVDTYLAEHPDESGVEITIA